MSGKIAPTPQDLNLTIPVGSYFDADLSNAQYLKQTAAKSPAQATAPRPLAAIQEEDGRNFLDKGWDFATKRSTIATGLLGAGLLGVGEGIYFHKMSNQRQKVADTHPGSAATHQRYADTYQKTGNTLLALGLASVGASFTVAITGKKDK